VGDKVDLSVSVARSIGAHAGEAESESGFAALLGEELWRLPWTMIAIRTQATKRDIILLFSILLPNARA